jgi:hypothetical protein
VPPYLPSAGIASVITVTVAAEVFLPRFIDAV